MSDALEDAHCHARGDLGAIPDQQWTDIWSTWSREDVEAWFAQAASWGLLNIVQAGQLIQGLPPQPPGWQYTRHCMVDVVDFVERLQWDIDLGVMPNAMTPAELARWCAAMKVPLPPAFSDALEKPSRPATQCTPEPTVAKAVSYPAWVPHGISVPPPAAPKVAKAGRPRVREATYRAVRSAADELIMSQAREGHYLPGREVAKRLVGTDVAAGMKAANIHRRLKKHLPTSAAKATAAKAQRRLSRKAAAK